MKTAQLRKSRFLAGGLLILALMLSLMPANIALAQSPTVTPGYTAFDESLISARFRSFGNTGGDEIYLGVPDLGNQPRAQRQFTWAQGTNQVTVVYDPAGPSLTATVINSNGTYTLVNTNLVADLAAKGKTRTLADLNIMQITVASRDAGTSAALSNVVLDGAALGNFSGATPSFLDWMVEGVQLNDGFTLTGDIVLSGSFSTSQENSRIEIRAGYKTPPPTTAGLSANDTTICVGDPTTINVNFASITGLYGYEFKVNYPVAGFTATGAFVNDWFDTTGAYIPWNGTPDGGVVKFAASKQAPAGMPVSGSGTVAQLTLTATTAGVYDITLSDVLLGDRDGNRIAADVAPNKVTVEVCGLATVSGKVTLQGRSAPPTGTLPPTSGTVTLADAGFGAFSATFDATGTFTINNVKVAPGGTNYTITAAHGLYLSNQLVQNLTPGATVTLPDTRLKGGDADNSGLIEVNDLACIGGSFGATPVTCGVTGGSDINADGLVNILDLVLPGGNFGLASPQTW